MREKLHIFGNVFCVGTWNLDAVTLVVVRGGFEVPPIDTVGGTGAVVARCLMYNDSGDRSC